MEELKKVIEREKIIVISRGTYGEKLLKLANAMYRGGMRLMEVTFDQANPDCEQLTVDAIRMLREKMPCDMHIGAGTVLTVQQVEKACAAGTEYVISPNGDLNVIRRTKELGNVSIPGAMTPTEMMNCHMAGADYIKVFPAGRLGLGYLKDIMTPLNHLKFIAAGGVTPDNLKDFLNLGFVGAGVSGYLTQKNLIAEENFEELEKRAALLYNTLHV